MSEELMVNSRLDYTRTTMGKDTQANTCFRHLPMCSMGKAREGVCVDGEFDSKRKRYGETK